MPRPDDDTLKAARRDRWAGPINAQLDLVTITALFFLTPNLYSLVSVSLNNLARRRGHYAEISILQ